MNKTDRFVQVTLNIGADVHLSQAEMDSIIKDLQSEVSELKAGPVDIIRQKDSLDGVSKGEPFITIAVVALQYVVPKLIDVLFDMIKQHKNNQVKVVAQVGGEQIRMDSRTDPAELQEIKGRVQAASEVEESPDRRYALLIGTTSYRDTRLNQLASPEIDVKTLADILRDPDIGGYDDVALLLNQSSSTIQQAVEQFFKRKANTDLLLLYFSGHGVRGEDGGLYLAAENTDLETIRSTSLSSDFIKAEMDRSKSERQILILDCCYSGAFVHGVKAAAVGVPVNAASAFKGNGFGRVILTASDRTQVAWEGQNITGEVQKSVFTEHLIEGLRSGEADHDRDGWIGLEELYKYVYNRMVKSTRDQTPLINAFNMKGSIILARNPRPRPMELPADIQALIESPLPEGREAAVSALSRLFQGSHYGMALAARKALEKLALDDSRRVSDAASRALGLLSTESPSPPPVLPLEKAGEEIVSEGGELAEAWDKPVGEKVPDQPNPAPPEEIRTPPPASPWWTNLKPPPGTRANSGTKSGPSLDEAVPAIPIEPGPGFTAPAPAFSAGVSPPDRGASSFPYPSFGTTNTAPAPPRRGLDSLREPETLALVMGILSVILFFLPVSLYGISAGRRAVKSSSLSSKGRAGLALSWLALAVQVLILLTLILFGLG